MLQISLQFALHFAQRARSWHTFVCIIKALVPLDTIVLASLKDLSYHKKRRKIHPLISIGTQRFPKKERKKKLKREGGTNRKHEAEPMRGDSPFLLGEGH